MKMTYEIKMKIFPLCEVTLHKVITYSRCMYMSVGAILVLRKLIKNETELFGESLKMLWPCLKQVVNNLENF